MAEPGLSLQETEREAMGLPEWHTVECTILLENASGQLKARVHLKSLLFCKQLISSLSVPFSLKYILFLLESKLLERHYTKYLIRGFKPVSNHYTEVSRDL